MKRTRKLFAAVLAVVMCLAMGAMAWADESTTTVPYDETVSVTGLANGDTVKFYQVIEWVGETEGNVAGWKAKSPYDTVLTQAKLTEVLIGTPDNPETTEVDETAPATGITSELAGKLAKLAGEDGATGTIEDGTATLTVTKPGMWMALVTPADANTVYNPVFVSSDYNTEQDHEGTAAMSDSYADAVAKSSTLTLTKTASTTEDQWDDQSSHTTAVGDTVNFTVTTTIPGYGDVYTNPHFVLTDSLTDLKLNKDSVAVAGLTAGTQYTLDAQDDGYTITFAESYLKSLKTATEVTITYSAVVTSEAGYAVNEEDNEVSIEYSHNPNQQSDYDVKKDTTQHYTFTLDAEGAGSGTTVSGKKTSELVKIGVDASGKPITETTETSKITNTETWEGPLQGAVFGLFTDSAGTVPYKDKAGNDVTATTDEHGRMSFAGLDAGTYYFKEMSAPQGFVKDTTVHKVEIIATTKSVKVTEWYKDGVWSSTDNGGKKVEYDTDILESYTVKVDDQLAAEYKFKNAETANSTDINWTEAELVEHPFEIENKQGVELPSTGGMGTTILYVAGAALVIGAGVALVARRRVNSVQ